MENLFENYLDNETYRYFKLSLKFMPMIRQQNQCCGAGYLMNWLGQNFIFCLQNNFFSLSVPDKKKKGKTARTLHAASRISGGLTTFFDTF